jgi:hypothetical protein
MLSIFNKIIKYSTPLPTITTTATTPTTTDMQVQQLAHR